MTDRIDVLLVENDHDLREVTAAALEREDERLAVRTAASAGEIRPRLTDGVDCVVSDYETPGTDGLELLDSVREDRPDLPVILYTANSPETVASEALERGVTDYLRKGTGQAQYELLAARIRNAVEAYRMRQAVERQREQYRWLFERAPVMFAMYRIEDGRPLLEEANDQFYEKLGYDPADLRGEPVSAIYTDAAAEAAMDGGGLERALNGEFGTEERTLVTADGEHLETLNRCVPRHDDDGSVSGLLTLYLDVTRRRASERQRALFRELVDHALDEMYVIDPETGAFVAVNDAACRNLGYDREALLEMSIGDIDASGAAEGWRDSKFVHTTDLTRREVRHRRSDGTTYPVEIVANHVELGHDSYLFAVARKIADRKDYQRQLGRLREVTRRLIDADDVDRVVGIAVEAADKVLGLDVAGFHVPTDGGDALVPAETTAKAAELFGEPPRIDRGEGLAWRVFERGEPTFVEDVRDHPDVYDPETPVRSEMLLPADDHGVFMAASTEVGAFDDTDLDLARILVSNLGHAIESAQREEKLRRRERELQRENDRLETVASIISHDLRNPLNVCTGHLELAREECDSEHLDRVGSSLDRSIAIIEDMLTIVKQGKSIEGVTPVSLEALAGKCEQNVETADADIRLESDCAFEADADRVRHILENLFRNAAEHGGPDVTVRVGRLDDGFYVADDGPGIAPGQREEVFEVGYSNSSEGTGFGLPIVEQVADSHGWDVTVTESRDGGARFEITGVHPE